jgi:arylformamidase
MARRIVDLTVTVGQDTKSPPSTDLRVQLTRHHRGPGFWQVTSAHLSLHTGSHVDSPLHCFADGGTTEAIELERVCGQGVLIDLGDLEPSTEITAAMLEEHHAGPLEDRIAILRSGWTDRAWGDFPRFFVESPYLTVEAAEWLASRRPKAVCFDFFEEYAARLPEFTSEDFRVHRTLLGAGVLLIEQATRLGELRGRRFEFFAPFCKLAGTEGAPARIFALVEG